MAMSAMLLDAAGTPVVTDGPQAGAGRPAGSLGASSACRARGRIDRVDARLRATWRHADPARRRPSSRLVWRRSTTRPGRSPRSSTSTGSSSSSSIASATSPTPAMPPSGWSTTSGVIERFLTCGISAVERARIGAPPRGRGLLGVIIHEGRSIRLADLGRRLRGASASRPTTRRCTSFLGVPVDVRGGSVGNLYLTDKRSALEFSDDDQQIVEHVRPPRRDRHRERPAARAGRPPGDRRGARADRPRPARRHHPGPSTRSGSRSRTCRS